MGAQCGAKGEGRVLRCRERVTPPPPPPPPAPPGPRRPVCSRERIFQQPQAAALFPRDFSAGPRYRPAPSAHTDSAPAPRTPPPSFPLSPPKGPFCTRRPRTAATRGASPPTRAGAALRRIPPLPGQDGAPRAQHGGGSPGSGRGDTGDARGGGAVPPASILSNSLRETWSPHTPQGRENGGWGEGAPNGLCARGAETGRPPLHTHTDTHPPLRPLP